MALIGETERFVPFKEFPWFKDARISELVNVELPSSHHLYWPELDVDLAVDSIEHPERFPLVSRGRSNKAMQPTRSAAKPRRVPSARKKTLASARLIAKIVSQILTVRQSPVSKV